MADIIREEAYNRLDEIRNFILQKSGGHDDGSAHEILRDYAAQSTKDVYTIVQDSEDGGRGEPVGYSPTREEWADTGKLMEKLHRMDTEGAGAFLLKPPKDTPGLGLPRDTTKYTLNGKRFKIEVHPDNSDYFRSTVMKEGAFYLPTDKSRREPLFRAQVSIQSGKAPDSPAPGNEAEQFEQLITSSKVFISPVYAAEKDVDTRERRSAYQLFPESPIHPMKTNRLDLTTHKISGAHTPWGYVSYGKGTVFTTHKEDGKTSAIHAIHAGGKKRWNTVAAHHERKFEDVIAEDFKIKDKDRICDNWIREMGLYPRQVVLKKHKIHHCSFTQAAGEVVVLFPHTYHWGYNEDTNVSEAVNFGDKYWSPIGAKFCAHMNCSHQGTIQETHWERRQEGELQKVVGIREFTEAEEDVPSKSKAAKRSSADNASSRTRAAPSKLRDAVLPRKRTGIVSEAPVTKKRLRSQGPAPGPSIGSASVVGRDSLPPHRSLRSLRSTAASNPKPACAVHSQEIVPGCAGSALIDNSNSNLVSVAEHNADRRTHALQSLSGDYYKKWDDIYKSSSFRPSSLARDLQSEHINVGKDRRSLDPSEVKIITNWVVAFGGKEVFFQLKDAFQPLRKNQLSKAPQNRAGSAATFVQLLDLNDGNGFCVSVYNRLHLAMFAVQVTQLLKGERRGMDTKIKTQVYEKIMEEAYEGLNKQSDEWNKKYRALEERYKKGKRWLMLATTFSWLSFLLLPRDGTGNVIHQKLHKLPNEVFDLLMDHVTKHKKKFLLKICKRLEQAITIGPVGNFKFRGQIRLESTSIDEINSYPEMSDGLSMLAQATVS
jgi:hypothetical protein